MFDNIVGNEKVKEILEKSVKCNKTSHSYLFIGTSGIGKKLIAKEFAKMLLCLNEKKYCNNCKSCIEFNSNNNPDFIFINTDNGSKKITEKPIISKNKICLIDDADLMTIEAQNCLLKTLEEPPTYMTIILIGTNESDFLPTIKSRCTIMHFEKINDKEIEKYLRENIEDTDSISNMISIADGSIGKVINLKNKSEIYNNIYEIIENLEKCDIIDILKKADEIYKIKEEVLGILDYINVLLIKQSRKKYKYANCIKVVEETKKRIKSNSNYNMCIDYMLFNIWGEVNEKYSRGAI